MNSLNEQQQLTLLRDRDELHCALLSATPKLATKEDANSILTKACNTLLNSSDAIKAAWMYYGPADVKTISPLYACGDNELSVESINIDCNLGFNNSPLHLALTSGEHYYGVVNDQPTSTWHTQAMRSGLKSFAILPFVGEQESINQGVVIIYSDQEDYFERMGLEPFLSFANLGQVLLDNANLRTHLNQLATFDHLTKLLNRRALQEILENEHAKAKRYHRKFSVLLLDMDHFKLINDHYGHHTGDQVLINVARIAKEALRDYDWLGRWGGEEFLCLLPDTDREEATHIAERIRTRIAETPSLAEHQSNICGTVSVGLACFPDASKSLDAVIACADGALYEAKRSGRNRVIVGSKEFELFALASELESALREKRVVSAYQPIIDIQSGEVFALEALARIKTEDSLMEATEFIQAASQLQLIHQIDFAILQQTLDQHAFNAPLNSPSFFMNISADLLRQKHLLEKLYATINEKLSAGQTLSPIIIEITERELLSSPSEVIQALQPFLDVGAKLAIDDFGSGYSSFQYLADLPVDFLKIEGTLVKRGPHEPRVKAILQGIQDIARELGLITVAEYIEDEETLTMVRELGVNLAQGYYLGKPSLDPKEFCKR